MHNSNEYICKIGISFFGVCLIKVDDNSVLLISLNPHPMMIFDVNILRNILHNFTSVTFYFLSLAKNKYVTLGMRLL